MSHSARLHTSRRLLLLGLAAVSVSGAVTVADAHPPYPPHRGADFDVIVEDAWGRPLDEFPHRGERFVMGDYGDRYAIRLVNRTAERVEAVLSVDGRDAISGRKGDYVRQRGYLIRPFDSVVVSGFRQSLDQVATFRFTAPGDSYSSRMGTPENVGVIGAAFFTERERVRWRPPRPLAETRPKKRRRRNPNSRSGAPASPRGGAEAEPSAAPESTPKKAARARGETTPPGRSAGERRRARHHHHDDHDYEETSGRDNLGTEYGESRTSRVTPVEFERARTSQPDLIVTIRYDDRTGLANRGIDVAPEPKPTPWWCRQRPLAFPESHFAPPPP